MGRRVGLLALVLVLGLGRAARADVEHVPAETLAELGVSVPRGQQAEAVIADLAAAPGPELAVLCHSGWREEAAPSSLRLHRQVQDRWVAWIDLELDWPDWASEARLEARVLEAGSRVQLLVTYDTGGSAGGEVVDVYSQSGVAWRRTRSATASYYRIQDVDGDGVSELLAASLLPAADAFPDNGARRFWWSVHRYRGGRIEDCSAGHRAFYADRLRALRVSLRRLEDERVEAHEREHVDFLLAVYQSELAHLDRLLAGQDPFPGCTLPWGGPVCAGE